MMAFAKCNKKKKTVIMWNKSLEIKYLCVKRPCRLSKRYNMKQISAKTFSLHSVREWV